MALAMQVREVLVSPLCAHTIAPSRCHCNSLDGKSAAGFAVAKGSRLESTFRPQAQASDAKNIGVRMGGGQENEASTQHCLSLRARSLCQPEYWHRT